jgi:hypothetical protein
MQTKHFCRIVVVTDEKVQEELARIDGNFRDLRGEIKETQRLLIQCFFGICTLMVLGFMFLLAGIALPSRG